MAMFLMTVGHNLRNFLIQDVFQHSGETVSRYFHTVLHALAVFSKEMIKPPPLDDVPNEILRNTKHSRGLKTVLAQSMERTYQQ